MMPSVKLPGSAHVLQAAAIPYRWNDGRLEVAVITRRQGGETWIVPKGHVEPGETPRQSARREANEEAGLLGRIGPRPLGSYRYKKRREAHFVVVFLLRVTKELRHWSEDDFRQREWLRVERAIERVRERGLRHLLRDLRRRRPA
jgi:8-oxo-dGTP pyrophosphatase MutT (NUDIX family)